ncbi:M18 family aminopeptidase [Spirochaetia bacterium]|nr:M18 family aminopeptidase [Spirochaetia bacterium]
MGYWQSEREFTAFCREYLQKEGFVSIGEAGEIGGNKPAGTIPAGTKIFKHVKEKTLVFAVTGSKPLSEGFNMVAAHVDSPRIDCKTNPLYEKNHLALFDTRYYGGIKPYQWTAMPLSMHGVVFTKDGGRKNICIGEEDADPIFTITDLLPHLAREQMKKTAAEFIGGEELDILAGSKPYKTPEQEENNIEESNIEEKVKLNILNILFEKYGMTEQDFSSAEIEFVPAFPARDLGLDRSMIGAYGHDDRCCAFAAFSAAVELSREGAPEKTIICLLVDKEETGSYGNTGSQSRLLENFIAQLSGGRTHNAPNQPHDAIGGIFANAQIISADVNAGFDPNYADVYDTKTSSYLGKGITVTKYPGRGGSDAGAEFCHKVQSLFDKNNVRWQHGDMGKVGAGGGGTIAWCFSNLGAEVIDCGIPVLSMHSPFEVISKIDLWTCYKAYRTFLNAI